MKGWREAPLSYDDYEFLHQALARSGMPFDRRRSGGSLLVSAAKAVVGGVALGLASLFVGWASTWPLDTWLHLGAVLLLLAGSALVLYTCVRFGTIDYVPPLGAERAALRKRFRRLLAPKAKER